MKNKALEICKNLTTTINTMKPPTTVESSCSIAIPTRVKKSALEKIRTRLMKLYKLTQKDLKNGITSN
jgi:hypothetical protein